MNQLQHDQFQLQYMEKGVKKDVGDINSYKSQNHDRITPTPILMVSWVGLEELEYL